MFSTANIGLAAEVWLSSTRNYTCNAHNYYCSHITFISHGNTTSGTIYDRYFSSHQTHWPNAFREDNVWSYTVGTTGYAKGKYTVYSSLITAWASLAFTSQTRTITHIY